MIILITSNQCPHCRVFFDKVMPHVKCKDVVVIQMHDLPLILGPERVTKLEKVKLQLPMLIHVRGDKSAHPTLTLARGMKADEINAECASCEDASANETAGAEGGEAGPSGAPEESQYEAEKPNAN